MRDKNSYCSGEALRYETGTADVGQNVCLTKAIEPTEQHWDGQESYAKAAHASLPGIRSIGLLSHCGTGNLGDEATVATVLQNIKSRWPTAFITGLSMDPEDTTRRHGIRCFPMRQSVFPFEREWSTASHSDNPGKYADRMKAALKKAGPLFQAAKAIRHALIVRPAQFIRETVFLGRSLLLTCELDLIVVCGGGQLLDWGGPWAFPYTIFKWVVLAKFAGAKCIFLNSGAGPLNDSLSRWFVKRALSMADYISLRDRASSELLKKIGFSGNVNVVADSVWGLRLPDGLTTKQSAAKDEFVIGIAPMAYGDSSRHWVDDHLAYHRLIDSLAEFSGRMLTRGHRIKLFSSDIWFDSQALADLEAAIHRNYPVLAPGRVTREPVTNIGDLLASLSRVDCYVTCRFHGVVFASLLSVPALALSPHPKVTSLMEDMGMSHYCVDISKCDAGDLTDKADDLIANIDEVRARIDRHVAQYKSQLTSQFEGLFLDNVEAHSKDEDALSIRSVT